MRDKRQEGSATDKSLPTIHYTWIGPPPGSADVQGHDVEFPKLMAKQNKSNPIVFWCLDQYKKDYEEKFKDHPEVQVKLINSLVNEHSQYPGFKQRAKEMQELIRDVLPDNGKLSIRDRVLIKDIFAVYLLMTQGGYVLDTNIRPTSDRDVKLPYQDGFKIAKYSNKDEAECFLMYSNKKDVSQLEKVFDGYTKAVRTLQGSGVTTHGYGREKYGNLYIENLLSVNPTYMLGENGDPKDPYSVSFQQLGITKIYYNTHKSREEAGNTPMIFYMVKRSNYEGLTAMIEAGANVNTELSRTNEYLLVSHLFGIIRNLTPLHLAIEVGDAKLVDILLRNGADLNAAASVERYIFNLDERRGYDEIKMTPLEFAKKLGKEDIVELIEQATHSAIMGRRM